MTSSITMQFPVLDAAQTTRPAAPQRAVFNEAQAREAAESFETVFLTQMVNHMFAGIKSDGYFGGGHAETIYRSMINEEYARVLTERGGIGIADAVMGELLKLQEVE